jgi:uncharacterized membrane protein YeaQ/YmgE (transglycosylase-associated protein family)
MALFAMGFHPGGIAAWVVVGLLAGWLADKVADGSGFGLFMDLVLGLTGALIGGFVLDLMVGNDTGVGGDAGFAGSLAVALLGACVLLTGARFLAFTRRA